MSQATVLALLTSGMMQETAFGAVLEVFIDIASRGVLWAWALQGPLGAMPILLEAFTFLCTHSVSVAVCGPAKAGHSQPYLAWSCPDLQANPTHAGRIHARIIACCSCNMISTLLVLTGGQCCCTDLAL